VEIGGGGGRWFGWTELRERKDILCLCDGLLGDVRFPPYAGGPGVFGTKVGATTRYPHKTIWGKGEIRIELLQDDSEACMPHLQKQRMRQFLPLPDSTGTGAKNRTTAGIMYELLRKLPAQCGPIANGRTVASNSTRIPGAVEPAGFRSRNGLRPMDAAGARCRRERNAVYGASLGGSRGAGCGGGVRDLPRVGLRQQGKSRPPGRGIEVARVLVGRGFGGGTVVRRSLRP
jgi:hypothetical protein